MKIIDLNILIYGVNESSFYHTRAKEWLEGQLHGTESLGIPWIVTLGFLRIMTNGKIFPEPLGETQAIDLVDRWLTHPLVHIPAPKPDHWNLVRDLITEAGTAGNLTSDIHLAAITIQHGASLATLDDDFGRFRGLRWEKPFS